MWIGFVDHAATSPARLDDETLTLARTVELVIFGNCPRCGTDVVSVGAYGDRKRHDIHAQLIGEGVPADGRFVLEPCGDVIDAAQIQLRKIDNSVTITFRRDSKDLPPD